MYCGRHEPDLLGPEYTAAGDHRVIVALCVSCGRAEAAECPSHWWLKDLVQKDQD